MASRNKKDHFLVQGSILAAATILSRLIGLLYRIPMQRIIGKEGTGVYANAYELYGFALILSSFSLPLAISKLVASRSMKKEYRNSYRIFLCSFSFAFVVGLVASLVIFFGADFLAIAIFNNTMIALPLKVLAPTIFVFAIMGVLRGFFQGKNTMIPTAVSQLLEQIVNAIVSVAASYLFVKNFSADPNLASYGAAGGTMGTFAGACIALIFLLFVFVIYKPILNKQIRHDRTEYRESYHSIFKILMLTIAPIILSQTVYQISGLLDGSLFGHVMITKELTAFDIPVLENTLPGQYYTKAYRSTLYGIYSGEYRLLTNLPVAIASAMSAAIVTSIAGAKAKGLNDVVKGKIHSSIKFNMLIAIPSAVGMAVLASPILRLIFKDTFQLSANFLRLGSIAIVFYALSTISTAVLQGMDKMRIPMINSAISLGIHVVIVFVLLKFTSLSTYALVIGNVTFALVVCILNWISIEKYIDYKQELIKTFVIPTVSAGLMGVVAYFTHFGLEQWIGSNVIATIVAILVAVIVYFALLIFMKGVDEEELSFVPKGNTIIRVLKKMHLL